MKTIRNLDHRVFDHKLTDDLRRMEERHRLFRHRAFIISICLLAFGMGYLVYLFRHL